jgi:hypothetical protein
MLDIYKRMEAEGKIGKFYKDADGVLRAKPFMEFPKVIRVKMPDGTTVERIVNSAREELAAQSFEAGIAESDPVVKERNELLEMVAERDAKAQVQTEQMAQMKAELDEMRKLLVNRPVAKAEGDE